MMSSRNWPISPPPKTKPRPKPWQTSRHLFATCHIVCQPLSLPSPKRRPPPVPPTPLLSHKAQAPPGRARRRPEHHPHRPPLRLRTLNTLYLSTTPSLARLSVTPRSTLGCTPTATRPVNTGEVHMTCPLSPPATSTLTTNPPPPTLKPPLAPAQAARARKMSASSPPPSKLRARSPLLLKRGLPPSQVPNVDFSPLASPLPLTQTLHPLQQPSLT